MFWSYEWLFPRLGLCASRRLPCEEAYHVKDHLHVERAAWTPRYVLPSLKLSLLGKECYSATTPPERSYRTTPGCLTATHDAGHAICGSIGLQH